MRWVVAKVTLTHDNNNCINANIFGFEDNHHHHGNIIHPNFLGQFQSRMILSGKNEIPIGTGIKLFHVSYLGFHNTKTKLLG